MSTRVFILSDHTGITAGSIARALLAQFPDQDFVLEEYPFLDDRKKVSAIAEQIESLVLAGAPPLVFSSIVDRESRCLLEEKSGRRLFDIFQAFTPHLEEFLGMAASPVAGHLHGIGNAGLYSERIQALDYAMIHDDGSITRNYAQADIILIGVSRSGKTPTCMYLALHNGLQAANYPLVDEDLEATRLPAILKDHLGKLVALTIDPEQLQRIRQQRRQGSRYSSLEQCQWEVHQAEALFRKYRIPVIDTTAISIEEIAMRITTETLTRHQYR
ncbi:pyruvate, phosphate dikinase/phosphoenolpyruvate synthase regulator [Thiolapillus sp.]